MQEIAIKNLNDLQELDDFITQTNDKVDKIKGIVVANEDDIKLISKDIKELKEREGALKAAEGKLIKLAGINRIGEAIVNSSQHRLLANKNVQNAKKQIKDDAVKYFVEKATALISKSQAQVSYKASFDLQQIALDATSGKSTGFIDLMKTELTNLKLRLENNAQKTQEKLVVIKQFSNDLVRDLEYLLCLPIDILKSKLEARQSTKDREIQAEAESLAGIERVTEEIKAEEIKAGIERVKAEVKAKAEAKAEAEAKRVANKGIERVVAAEILKGKKYDGKKNQMSLCANLIEEDDSLGCILYVSLHENHDFGNSIYCKEVIEDTIRLHNLEKEIQTGYYPMSSSLFIELVGLSNLQV